jgi:hypothetical protein
MKKLLSSLTSSLTPFNYDASFLHNMHAHTGLLANLIYRNYVKGYLSHTKRMLVLSKRDPFPVSSVIAK